MKKSGFTLVELLVVIGIIAVLAAILIPVVTNARKSGYKATCMNNMREIGAALIAYRQDKAVFPDPSQVFQVQPSDQDYLRAMKETLQTSLLSEKKINDKKKCPNNSTSVDSYSQLYNYWGYDEIKSQDTTPIQITNMNQAEQLYKDEPTLNNNVNRYWHQNHFPDSNFPGLANPNCSNNTIVTICTKHTDMAGKYLVLHRDGVVDFINKPVIFLLPDGTVDKIKSDIYFWSLSKMPK